MATTADLIRGALEDLGAIGPGETVSAGDQDKGLRAFNQLVGNWNLNGLTVLATTRTEKVLTAGDADYTIGTSGNINITQPVFVESASLIASGSTNEVPLKIFTRREWAEFADKTTSGTPEAIYFQRSTATTGTIYVLPEPASADTLVLYTANKLSTVTAATISNSYALADGYEAALQAALAVMLAPSFGKAGSPELALIVEIARTAKADLKRANMEPVIAEVDSALQSGGTTDIETGEFS